MNTKKPMSLTSRVILGMVAGILTGFAIRTLFADNGFVDAYIVNGLFEVGGQIFVASLKNACRTTSVCFTGLRHELSKRPFYIGSHGW